MRKSYIFLLTLCIVYSVNLSFAQKPSDKEIKQSMLKAFKWQQKNPNHNLNDWTNGAYYIGVTKAYQTTGNKAYLNGLKKMAEWVKKHGAKKTKDFGEIEIQENLPPSWK